MSASALPDKALEVWSQYEVAVLSLVSTRLGQGDHPELAGNALLSLNDRTLQQADHARHLSLSLINEVLLKAPKSHSILTLNLTKHHWLILLMPKVESNEVGD